MMFTSSSVFGPCSAAYRVNVIKLAGSHLLIASDQLAYSASCAATCMACKPCGSRGGAVPCAAGMSVLAELARPCGGRQWQGRAAIPGDRCAKNVFTEHGAVPEMKEGPSGPACRSRLQTAVSCFSPKGCGGERYGQKA